MQLGLYYFFCQHILILYFSSVPDRFLNKQECPQSQSPAIAYIWYAYKNKEVSNSLLGLKYIQGSPNSGIKIQVRDFLIFSFRGIFNCCISFRYNTIKGLLYERLNLWLNYLGQLWCSNFRNPHRFWFNSLPLFLLQGCQF